MLSLMLDAKGIYKVMWPSSAADTIMLAEGYVAYEQQLSLEEQLSAPSLDLVRSLLKEARDSQDTAEASETTRASGSEQYQKAIDESMPLLKRAIIRLKNQYIDGLASLEGWGLHTKNGKNGVVVRAPAGESGWSDFLLSYVAQEETLDASQQVQDPPLKAMQELAARVSESRQARDSGRTQRTVAIQDRTSSVERLRDVLQTAAAVLTVTRYDGQVNRSLALRSFTVVEQTKEETSVASSSTETSEDPD